MTLPTDLGIIDTRPATIPPATVKIGNSYDFDFSTRDFVTDGDGLVAIVTDLVALEQALLKALRTARYTFLVYDHEYGNSFTAIDQDDTYTGDAKASLMRAEVIATLLADPHVQVVTTCTVDLNDDTAFGNVLDVSALVHDTFGRSITLTTTLFI